MELELAFPLEESTEELSMELELASPLDESLPLDESFPLELSFPLEESLPLEESFPELLSLPPPSRIHRFNAATFRSKTKPPDASFCSMDMNGENERMFRSIWMMGLIVPAPAISFSLRNLSCLFRAIVMFSRLKMRFRSSHRRSCIPR